MVNNMNIYEVLVELEKFSNEILSLGSPLEEGIIINFEKKYNIVLPVDYKILLRKYNGVNLYGTEIYGIDQSEKSYSLEQNYLFEHNEVGNGMPLYLVPFSPDGGGNHYCFDTRFNTEDSCPIIFWQHDYLYSEKDPPEVVNPSLADWIKEVMIDWVLDEYNYDGSEKT